MHVRLSVDGGRVFDAYKASKDLVLPPADKLELFRKLVCGAMIGTSKVTPDVAQVSTATLFLSKVGQRS